MNTCNEMILITGASGLLGRGLVNTFVNQQKLVTACYNKNSFEKTHSKVLPLQLDLLDTIQLESLFKKNRPSILIHCAGLTNVDICEQKPELAYHINAQTTHILASLAYKYGIQFVYISTDHLFDGKMSFYSEGVLPTPLNVYGLSKLQGEINAQEANPKSLIIRTNFFGKGTSWRHSLSDWIWDTLSEQKDLPAFIDSFFSPLSIPELGKLISELISKKAVGIFNVCGFDRLSKYEFALKFADYFELDKKYIRPVHMKDVELKAKRPQDMSLSHEKITNFLQHPVPNLQQSFQSIENDYKNERSNF